MSVSVVLLQATAAPPGQKSCRSGCRSATPSRTAMAQAATSSPMAIRKRPNWTEPLTFRPTRSGPTATANFTVKAPDFGATFDGVDASAAIPEVRYCCAAKVLPVLQAGYPIRSASQYDWTSFEPEDTTSHSAVWQEDLTIGDTPSRVAVGIDHAGQAHNDLVAHRRDPAGARRRSAPVRCPGNPACGRLNSAAITQHQLAPQQQARTVISQPRQPRETPQSDRWHHCALGGRSGRCCA
jgi:hypothetical protein